MCHQCHLLFSKDKKVSIFWENWQEKIYVNVCVEFKKSEIHWIPAGAPKPKPEFWVGWVDWKGTEDYIIQTAKVSDNIQ